MQYRIYNNERKYEKRNSDYMMKEFTDNLLGFEICSVNDNKEKNGDKQKKIFRSIQPLSSEEEKAVVKKFFDDGKSSEKVFSNGNAWCDFLKKFMILIEMYKELNDSAKKNIVQLLTDMETCLPLFPDMDSAAVTLLKNNSSLNILGISLKV